MADSGALASTPRPLPGHLRGTPSENQPGVRGRENAMAALPLAAHHGLAAETRTGMVRETILGGSTVAKGGGAGPGVALSRGLGRDPEQGRTGEPPARNVQPPESNLLRGGSAGGAGGLDREVGLAVRDEGIMEALGALKMVCPLKVPLIARAGQKTLTGLQRRVVTSTAGTGTLVVVHVGKINATVVRTEESPGAGEDVEDLTVTGARGGVAVIVASTISRRKELTTAGSPGTSTQVQATIQGLTHTAASMKTGAEVGGKILSLEILCLTDQAGLQPPAGL